MRSLSLACIAVAALLVTGAQAIPAHVCEGPAGARNPHCQPQTPPVPRPGVIKRALYGALAAFVSWLVLAVAGLALRLRKPEYRIRGL